MATTAASAVDGGGSRNRLPPPFLPLATAMLPPTAAVLPLVTAVVLAVRARSDAASARPARAVRTRQVHEASARAFAGKLMRDADIDPMRWYPQHPVMFFAQSKEDMPVDTSTIQCGIM
jgi:hypothetical protein